MTRIIQFATAIALIFTLAACGGGEDDGPTSAGPSPLSEKTFTFSNGAVFDAGLSRQEVRLAFGDLSRGEGRFTLRAGGEVAGGTATTGSCLLEVEASTFPTDEGPQKGEAIHLDPCVLDAGQLSAENTDTGIATRSTDSASLDPYAIGNTWTTSWTTSFSSGAREASDITSTITDRRLYREHDAVEIANVDTGDGYVDTFTRLIDPRTGGTIAVLDEGYIVDYDPYAGDGLPLPLEVGKTWTTTYTETVDETESTTESTRLTVTDFESVTTPAGTFMTFQINGTIDDVEGTFYYDPITRLFVKITGTAPDQDFETLLVSYDFDDEVS